MIKEGIAKLVNGMDLTYSDAQGVMRQIITGQATDAQIAAFLTALKLGGETAQEISAFASIMREHCRQIHPKVKGRLVDTCGTGGDTIKTFNISTASAFVLAGAGLPVAKHGNRSVTSKSGSADVLEQLGLNLSLEPRDVERAIEEVGIGFMYAPKFHPAMKRVIGPRREIGIRTVFNIIGPLANPANAEAQLLGVYEPELTTLLARALKTLNCSEAMVVHGLDGLDEVSTVGKTVISWLREGEVSTIEVTPKAFGVRKAKPSDIMGALPGKSAEMIFKVLNGAYGEGHPKRDIVLVNGAAGLVVGGRASDFKHGMELSRESIDSGAAYGKLKSMIKSTGGDLSTLEEMEHRHA